MEKYSILLWQLFNIAGILLIVYLVFLLVKKFRKSAILFLPIAVSFICFTSCINSEEDFVNQDKIEKLLNEYDFQLDSVRIEGNLGLNLSNLNEFEN